MILALLIAFGSCYLYKYRYTGYLLYPTRPYSASSTAFMTQEYVNGKRVWVIYDDSYWYQYDWKRL
jgi:hypothetical protein